MDSFVVDALATYRLTRLVTRDAITKPLREKAIAAVYEAESEEPGLKGHGSYAARVAWEGDAAPKVAKLITCPWCVGVWLGFGVMVLRRTMPRVWSPIATALALASVAALTEINEEG